MRRKLAALLCAVAMIWLAGCGSSAETQSPSKPESASSPATPTPTETTKTDYTEDEVNAAITKCAPLSENGADILDDITSPTRVLSLVSFKTLGKGVESDVFKCAFDELSIPDEVIAEINQQLGVEKETQVGNLNVLWTNDGGDISIYMSTENLHQ
jgi:hypothetical protein